LVGLHEVGNVDDSLEIDAFFRVLADHVEKKLSESFGYDSPKTALDKFCFHVVVVFVVVLLVFRLEEQFDLLG